jgi:ABC-type amino acid transport substrate-binding protein
MRGPDGGFSGISIDLFKAACDKLKLRYTIRQETDDAKWREPEKYGIDALVSMNVSARKEKTLDLGQAFFHTGLGIATRTEPKSGLASLASKLASISFLKGFGVLVLVLLVMGTVVWLLERKRKPEEFGGNAARGIAHGVFWAFESLVSKSDTLTRTYASRFFGLFWTFAIMILISIVTAELSAELTVNSLATTVSGPNDLPKVKVGCIVPEGFTGPAQRYLMARSIRYKSCGKSATDCLAALNRGEFDAVVDEAPVLAYQAKKLDGIVVLPGTFDNHGYAFGYPMGSPLRRKINVAMLEVVESQQWKDILAKYDSDM